MKKSFISDWWKVFKFTLKQSVCAKGFAVITILLAVLMFAGGILINIGMAYSEKNESDVYKIEKCYFINSSDLETIMPEGLVALYQENYPDIQFEQYAGSVDELAKKIAEETKYDDEGAIEYTKDVVLEVVKDKDEETKEESYLVKVYLPHNSEVTDEEAECLGEDFGTVVQQGKMLSIDVPVENQVMALSEVKVEYVVAGEEAEDEGVPMLRYIVSTILLLFMFMLLLVYGQSMGTVVSIEKSSKLMEYLLTIVKPYGLIFGKITAMSVIAIGQIILWLGMLVIGFILGDQLARELVYSEYSNEMLEIMAAIRKMEGAAQAFTPGAIMLAALAICVAILFFFMLAGLIASFISKADELQSAYSVYQMFLMLGFFGGYLAPAFGNNSVTGIVRWIPPCTAFMLPSDVMNGEVTLVQGMGHLAYLIVFSAILVYFTGKVYKDQLFNRGKEIKAVEVIKKIFVK